MAFCRSSVAYDLIVVGGGAAGVFAAITAKAAFPHSKVALLEKSAALLSKVRISGGGRCNVTHACFDPLALSKHYPRGNKELIGPFHRFQPLDTIEWFQSRGVNLKTEPDGRLFPDTDRSETIINCLLEEANKVGVEFLFRQHIVNICKDQKFTIERRDEPPITCDKILLATGSNQAGYDWAQGLGHSIQKPVPSLFTFNIPTSPLKEMSGISVDPVLIQLKGCPLSQMGPLLITHFGFSGPAVLKLSAWAARYFYEKDYCVEISLNWLPLLSREKTLSQLIDLKANHPHKSLLSENPFKLSRNLWKTFLELTGLAAKKRLIDLSNQEIQILVNKLHADSYFIEGKTTNKEEFVTCGGVSLKEVDFKTMQSKQCPGLFFAGEILDIDGVTGGFNFQNAWTTGFIAGNAVLT